MARYTFGGGAADAVWSTVTTGGNNFVASEVDTNVTMWSARTGGTQYTDLLDANSSPITYVTSGAGGQLPTFSGPDGITSMWADAGGSTRVRLETSIYAGTAADVLIGGSKALRSIGIPQGTATRLDPNLARAKRVTTPLTIPTGYSGNDIVEPQVLYDPDGTLWGSKYLMVAAPYYQSNAALENPSLWVSNDGDTWTVPAGVTNPLFPTGVQGDGVNSDPSLLIGADRKLYLTWNQYNAASTHLLVKASVADPSNLASWSTPVTVVDAGLQTSVKPTCPSGFWDPVLGQYVFYSLDTHNTGAAYPLQRWTSSSPTTAWTQSSAPTFVWPMSGRSAWHLNAYLVGDQHVLLISDTALGLSGPGDLFLAVSNDRGATWNISALPIMWTPGASGFWDSGVYRSAMVPAWRGDDFVFDLFYGGNLNNAWGIGRTTIDFSSWRVTNRTSTGQGYYYTTPGTLTGTWTPTGNGDCRVSPMFFDRTVTLTEIGLEITGAGDGASLLRFAVFVDNGSGAPSWVLKDLGTVAANTTGYVSVSTSLTLTPGLYWIAAIPQGTTTTWPQLRAHASGSPGLPGIGNGTALTVSQNNLIGWRQTGLTGALPSGFGVPSVTGFAPRVLAKVT